MCGAQFRTTKWRVTIRRGRRFVMRKPRNITRYSPGLALAALTTVTILALGHVALAQAQVATPSWTAATALPTLRANGRIAFTSDRDGNQEIYLMNPDGTNQTRLT